MEKVLTNCKDPFVTKDNVGIGMKSLTNSVFDLPFENDSTRHRRRYKSANRSRGDYIVARKGFESTAVLNKENLRLIASDYGHIYKSDAIFRCATPENALRAHSAHSTKCSTDCRSALESPFGTKSITGAGWRPGTGRSSVLSSRSRSASRLSRASYDKASTILAENDWSHIPSKDRKIAELILSRHGSVLELEDRKEYFHNVWEDERRKAELLKANEDMSRRKALIRERQMEELHRKMWKAYQHEVEQSTVQERENQLLLKAEKWRHLAEQQEQLRVELAAMRKHKNTSRKHSQEVTLLKKNAEDAKLRNLLAQMMEQSMVKAAHKRHILKLEQHWTLHHSNAEEINRHLERKAEVDKKFREQLDQLQSILEAKERKQQENYQTVGLQRRSVTTREQAVERQKLHQVNVMQERLNSSFKEWQQDLIHYHGLVSARATSSAQQQLTARKEDLRKERVAKMMLHDRRMEEILKEERKKVASLKHSQRMKQKRSEDFLQQKEQALLQSRAVACASAQLRSRLHELLEKDTFDKKLQRLKFEARVWRDVM